MMGVYQWTINSCSGSGGGKEEVGGMTEEYF